MQAIIFLVLFTLTNQAPTRTFSWDTTIPLLAALLRVVCGHAIFLKRLSQGRMQMEPSAKLQHFRATLLIRYGTREGPFLHSVVCYVLYGIDEKYLLINALTIALLQYYRPSSRLVIRLLKLDYSGARSWEDGTSVV